MQIINQSHEILFMDELTLQQIEVAGRTCYQSQDRITKDSAEKFVAMLQKRNHGAMLEFADITVKFITDRGVSHEMVRHRHCSFAQESTRYVKYDGNMEFILPVWLGKSTPWQTRLWKGAMKVSEYFYKTLLAAGWQPQQARDVLTNSLKTEIVVKANLRQWLLMFEQRTSKAAHPQMRDLMLGLLNELSERLPTVFGDT